MTTEQEQQLQDEVNLFVDQQYGLDNGGGNVMFGGEQIYLWSDGEMSQEEWVECGEQLVHRLWDLEIGLYDVASASTKSCTLFRDI